MISGPNFCKPGEEDSFFDKITRMNMVGMPVKWIWREDHFRPDSSDHADNFLSWDNIVSDITVAQHKIFSERNAENFWSHLCFKFTWFQCSPCTEFSPCKINYTSLPSRIYKTNNGPAAIQFNIIRMRSEKKCVKFDKKMPFVKLLVNILNMLIGINLFRHYW